MASPTCLSRCAEQVAQAGCQAMQGCSWVDPLPGVSQGSCQAGTPGQGSTVWVGIVLSLLGDIVINVGMNCMKHAHNINTDEFGDPIKHFAKIPWWWGGVFGIVGGEVANIVAYGYAPASIVTPMGAVGVLTNVVITSYALGEAFRPLQGVGIACVVAGIVLVVYYAPVTFIPIVSDTIWGDWMWTKEFAAYVGTFAFLVPASLLMSKKWGERSVVFYLLTCASISSLTIVSAKTFSTLLAAGIEKGFETEWLAPAPYVALFLMIVTAVLSMNFVNKAMMKFGNSLVVPTYYAFFTTFSVGSVAWVYREFDCLTSPLQIGLFLFGVVMTVSGVALLQVGAPSHPSDGDDDHNTSQNQVPLGVPFINSLDHSTSSTGTNHGGKYSAIWGSSFTGAALHYSIDKHHRSGAGGHGGKSFTRDGASLQGSMQTRLTMEAGLLSTNQSSIMERSTLSSPVAASYKRWVPVFEGRQGRASHGGETSRNYDVTPRNAGGGTLGTLQEEPKNLWSAQGLINGRRGESISPASTFLSGHGPETRTVTPVSAGANDWVVTAVTADTVYGQQGINDSTLTQDCLFPPLRGQTPPPSGLAPLAPSSTSAPAAPAAPAPAAAGAPAGLDREFSAIHGLNRDFSAIPRHSSSSFPGLDNISGVDDSLTLDGHAGAKTSRNVSPVAYAISVTPTKAVAPAIGGRVSLKDVRIEYMPPSQEGGANEGNGGEDLPLGVPVYEPTRSGVTPPPQDGAGVFGEADVGRQSTGMLAQFGVPSIAPTMVQRVPLMTVAATPPGARAAPLSSVAPPVPPRNDRGGGGAEAAKGVVAPEARTASGGRPIVYEAMPPPVGFNIGRTASGNSKKARKGVVEIGEA